MGFPVTLVLTLGEFEPPLKRMAGGLAMAAVLIATGATGSRGALTALVCMTVLTFLNVSAKSRIKLVVVLAVAVV